MNYITESTDATAEHSGSERIRLIHHNVKKIRASEKVGVKYMQKWEELVYARDAGKAEGFTEGITKGKAEGITKGKAQGEKNHLVRQVSKKLARGKTAWTIAEELEENLETIEGICRELKEKTKDEA